MADRAFLKCLALSPRRSLQHGAAAPYLKPAPKSLPSPSFASRPVWKEVSLASQQTPQEKRQVSHLIQLFLCHLIAILLWLKQGISYSHR